MKLEEQLKKFVEKDLMYGKELRITSQELYNFFLEKSGQTSQEISKDFFQKKIKGLFSAEIKKKDIRQGKTVVKAYFGVAGVADVAPVAGVADVAPVAPVAPVAGVAPVADVAPVAPVAGVAGVADVAPVAGVAGVAPVAPVAGVAPVAPVAGVADVAGVAGVADVAPVAGVAPLLFKNRKKSKREMYTLPNISERELVAFLNTFFEIESGSSTSVFEIKKCLSEYFEIDIEYFLNSPDSKTITRYLKEIFNKLSIENRKGVVVEIQHLSNSKNSSVYLGIKKTELS